MVLFSTMDAFAQAGGKKNVVEKDVFIAQQDTIATSSMAAVDGKIGLVLAGGGAKGFYHIGVIKALEENDIHPGAIYYTDVPLTPESELANREAVKRGIELRAARIKDKN